MKKLIVVLLLIPSMTLLYGQEIGTKQTIELPTNFHERLEFSGAYYGNNLWNPGLKFGAEYLWKEKQKIKKSKKNGTKTITKQRILTGDVGFYWDPRSHVRSRITELPFGERVLKRINSSMLR